MACGCNRQKRMVSDGPLLPLACAACVRRHTAPEWEQVMSKSQDALTRAEYHCVPDNDVVGIGATETPSGADVASRLKSRTSRRFASVD